jgi:hypothetical protein
MVPLAVYQHRETISDKADDAVRYVTLLGPGDGDYSSCPF